MKLLGIKSKLLFLTLIPTLVASLIFCIFFTAKRIIDLENTLDQKGSSILHQLSPMAKYGLSARNDNILHEVADAALDNTTSIESVAIFDNNKNIIAYTGPEQNKALGPFINQAQPLSISTNHQAGLVYYTTPLQSISGGTTQTLGWLTIAFNHNETTLAEYQTIFASFLIVLFGLTLSLFIARQFTKTLSDPITEIKRGLNRVLEGNLSVQIRTEAHGELGEIAQNIMRLARRYKLTLEEIEQNTEEATTDIRSSFEALEIKNIELAMAAKEALSNSRVKSEFIASMSHEIRTPMNGILGFTKLLLETKLTPHQHDYVNTIDKSATSLLTIINDILDYSKIEAGKLELDITPMNIRECLEDVLTILAPSAYVKRLELIPIVQTDVPMRVLGDPLRLKQILTNLIGNAIKFTEQGSITITVNTIRIEGQQIELQFKIKDSGIGLTVDEQKQLFQAFSQPDSKNTRKFGGTGLGLVICKKLINRMRGEIGVESEPRKGSTFWFTLFADTIAPIKSPNYEFKQLQNLPFLLYEQNPLSLHAIKQVFALFKSRLTATSSTDELVDYLKSPNDYKIIIISINQLKDNQASISSLLTLIKSTTAIPIMVLVNSNSQHTQADLHGLGVTLCISKPVSHRKIYHELCNLLFCHHYPEVKQYSRLTLIPFEPKILVVDDNPANLELLTTFVSQLNAIPIAAKDGDEAVTLCKDEQFDLILLDIYMPIMDGYTATKKIRQANQKNTTTPIVAVSANIQPKDQRELYALGVNDFLVKPINENELHQIIHKWVKIDTATQNSQIVVNTIKSNSTTQTIIDWHKSIELAGGNIDTAKKLFDLLLKDIQETRPVIRQAYSENNRKLLLEKIHRLHGACCYIGVTKLKNATEILEKQLKQDQADITQTFTQFESEIDAVVSWADKNKTSDFSQASSE